MLIADRVNVAKGFVDNFKEGRVPAIFVEKGLKANWKYNRNGLLKQALTGAAETTAVIVIVSREKCRD